MSNALEVNPPQLIRLPLLPPRFDGELDKLLGCEASREVTR